MIDGSAASLDDGGGGECNRGLICGWRRLLDGVCVCPLFDVGQLVECVGMAFVESCLKNWLDVWTISFLLGLQILVACGLVTILGSKSILDNKNDFHDDRFHSVGGKNMVDVGGMPW